jgi:hypothetical protein
MLTMAELAQTLQTYGAWGLCAVLMVALVVQWRSYVAVRDRYEEIAQQQVKGAIELVEECTKAGVEQKNALVSVTKALEALERRLENVEKRVG